MITDIHDAITSLAAHGKELPVGLTAEMREEIDRLVSAAASIALGQSKQGQLKQGQLKQALSMLLACVAVPHATSLWQRGSVLSVAGR